MRSEAEDHAQDAQRERVLIAASRALQDVLRECLLPPSRHLKIEAALRVLEDERDSIVRVWN